MEAGLTRKRVYLAGPDVFLPDAAGRAGALKQICARYGLEGVSPLDAHPEPPAAWSGLAEPARIHRQNEAHILRCDALIANLTPFRGPSADVGTAFELGFMRALGRPVFGYATTALGFTARTLAALGAGIAEHGDGWRDAHGMAVEAFGLFDNLMLDGGITASGGILVAEDRPETERWSDLTVFERCVRLAAERLKP